jgi:hypothetical protein
MPGSPHGLALFWTDPRMSLIKQIQQATTSVGVEVPTLLRQCKLLAAHLRNEPFAQWVEWELNGYPDVDSLPAYRVTTVDSYGNFEGQFKRAHSMKIEVSVLPEAMRERYRHAYMLNGVSVYVDILANSNDKGAVHERWPLGITLEYASKLIPGTQCIAAWKLIPTAAMARLLDAVKTKVLGFVIDIEREDPRAGDVPFHEEPPIPQQMMTQIFNNNIGTLGNLANTGTGYSQVANMTVAQGDWNSLQAHLRKLGLTDEDFAGLRPVLDAALEEGRPAEAALEQETGRWIGGLASKAARRAGNITLDVAAAVITKLLTSYLS